MSPREKLRKAAEVFDGLTGVRFWGNESGRSAAW